jgi:hypothetical protein
MRTVLVTDTTTNETLVPGRNKVKEYFDDVIVVNIPKQFNQMQCSRYLKTLLRPHVDGDTLYIDIDTIVCGSLSELDELNVEIGAVPDWHKSSRYYNGGLMYAKDTEIARKFYRLWHELWLKDVAHGINTDQHSLNLANKELGYVIDEIEGSYNYQIESGIDKYRDNAKIIHYFVTGRRSRSEFERESVLLKIRKNDGINEYVDFLVKNVIACFNYESLPITSIPNPYLVNMYRYYPSILRVFDFVAHVFLFFGERLKWIDFKLSSKNI